MKMGETILTMMMKMMVNMDLTSTEGERAEGNTESQRKRRKAKKVRK